MTNKNIEPIEIYPKILVYKNMFKDISKSHQILLDSLVKSEDRLFSQWTKWSIFGEYMAPVIPSFSLGDKYATLESIETKTKNEEEQKDFAMEMMENFHLVTEDYIKRYNIDVSQE